MKRFLLLICIAFTVVPAEAQRVFSLDDCIQTGLERNYSIRIIRNEQQISDNNATPGNAGYLPTVDLSSGFSGTLNNNNNKLSDGTTEKTNGIHNRRSASATSAPRSNCPANVCVSWKSGIISARCPAWTSNKRKSTSMPTAPTS